MGTLRLNTIYPAFMGECNMHGIGAPCTFVRLSGCNLRCYYKTKGGFCDTPEALSIKDGREVSVVDIMDEVMHLGNKVVCLTGGEPLLQDVGELLTLLSGAGFNVVVETNGSRSVAPYRHIRGVSFVVDVKTSSSAEAEKMLESNYGLLGEEDFVKFVIDDDKDFSDFYQWYKKYDFLRCKIGVGLFWGSSMGYKDLIERLSAFGVRGVYLNMQAHKMSCLYDSYTDEGKSITDIIIPKNI